MHSLAHGLASPFLFLFRLSNPSHCGKESTMPRSLVSTCPPSPLKYDYSHIDAHQTNSKANIKIRKLNMPFCRKKIRLSEYINFIIFLAIQKKRYYLRYAK
jgi:hypothetical protein